MAQLGAPEIVLLIIGALLLFGYKRLPDASRSLGRSLRIFKGEMKGLKDDDVATRDPAGTAPVRGEPAQLEGEARIAEARAEELRARADRAWSGSADGVR